MIHGGLLVLLLVASFLLQELLPFAVSLLESLWRDDGGALLCRARVLFVPAFFFSAVLTVPFPGMLALAFACGFTWDAVYALIWGEGSPGFGSGPVLFGMTGAVMHGARGLFLQGKWLGPVLLAGVCVFGLLLGEYSWINFRAGDFRFPPEIWAKIGVSAALTTATVPVFLFIVALGMRWTGYGEILRFPGQR